MKLDRFLNVVPKAVQRWSAFLLFFTLLVGLVTGFKTVNLNQCTALWALAAYGGGSLVFGMMLAIWLLCVGFVFADARQRGMRASLWVMVVALFPHLLGFLLYFVIRQPIAATCTHCGTMLASQLRFCSSCGTAQYPPSSTEAPLTASPS